MKNNIESKSRFIGAEGWGRGNMRSVGLGCLLTGVGIFRIIIKSSKIGFSDGCTTLRIY